MSAAAKRKSNTIQLNKKLSHIASLKNQRQLKKKKRKCCSASPQEGVLPSGGWCVDYWRRPMRIS